MNKSVQIILSAVVLSLVVVVILFITTSEGEFGDKKSALAELGGDFALNSSSGEVMLSDFHGKVVVMYFGFLTCPEVCPNSMGVMSAALNRLSPVQLSNTQALLVSVDPKRDSLEKLAEYAEFYHPSLIGLTGTIEQVNQVTKQYGAYYNYSEIESVTADYGVQHSSRYYVINKNGRLIAAMRHSTTPNELYAQLSELLEQETES